MARGDEKRRPAGRPAGDRAGGGDGGRPPGRARRRPAGGAGPGRRRPRRRPAAPRPPRRRPRLGVREVERPGPGARPAVVQHAGVRPGGGRDAGGRRRLRGGRPVRRLRSDDLLAARLAAAHQGERRRLDRRRAARVPRRRGHRRHRRDLSETATLVVESDRKLLADGSRLRQLFENLSRNVDEHCGPETTATVRGTDDGFVVADDGPGLPADIADSIFEDDYDSSRLGLFIVERVASGHNWQGEVTVGDGTRFTFSDVGTVADPFRS